MNVPTQKTKQTAAIPPKTAICRRNCFCHLSPNYTFLNHLRPTSFFKNIQTKMQKLREFCLGKNELVSNVSTMSNSARNDKKKLL